MLTKRVPIREGLVWQEVAFIFGRVFASEVSPRQGSISEDLQRLLSGLTVRIRNFGG